MVAWWWSWLLMVVGVTGLFLAGKKRKVGWMIGVGVQLLWIIYAIVSKQWGFIMSAFVYGAVNTINWRRWQREEKESVT